MAEIDKQDEIQLFEDKQKEEMRAKNMLPLKTYTIACMMGDDRNVRNNSDFGDCLSIARGAS